jgi:four helix bundle protein
MEIDKAKTRTEFKKRLYTFTLRLIEFIDKLPHGNVSRRIGDQMLRSGTSIIGNFVEGQSASSKRDSANYLNTSLKSSNESKLWLALLRDSGRAQRDDISWFLDELDELSKIFASSVLLFRRRLPHAERPYRTLGYAAIPLFFTPVASMFVLYTILEKPAEAWAGLTFLALGVPVYYFWRKKNQAGAPWERA